LIILITCTKARPSKDIPPKPAANIIKKDATKIEEASPNNISSNNNSSKKVKSSKENAKPNHHKNQHSSHHSSDRHQKNQLPSKNGVKSKEMTELHRNELHPDKKNSNEKLTSSSDDPKIFGKKGNLRMAGSAENLKQSEHIDTELRKTKQNITTTTVTKGSHEITTKTASKENVHKVVTDFDRHRGKTPAFLPEEDDRKTNGTTVSKIDFNKTHPGTDDEGLFRKPTEIEESGAADDKQKEIQPTKFPKNAKEKKIAAGMMRKASEYPTMADVVSDWSDVKELNDAKMKKGSNNEKKAANGIPASSTPVHAAASAKA
uniref:Uncharacterized protein n=1 Tax=Panagrolaimus sp. ES5 TaxID=591445 RepID=A0AC34FLY8_9BILA